VSLLPLTVDVITPTKIRTPSLFVQVCYHLGEDVIDFTFRINL